MNSLADLVKGQSLWHDALRRLLREKIAILSFSVIIAYVLVALLVKSGVLASDWQLEIGGSREAPSFERGWRFWLGTDIFGRSMLLKVIQGAYMAMYVGFMTCVISVPLGAILGALAGYFGGWVDELITWLYTTISNIPEILLLIVVSFAAGKGIFAMIVALAFTTWIGLARLVRGEFLKHKNRDYVVAAASIGGSHIRRMFVHIFPNVLHIIIISFSLRFVDAIKSEVVLTYLGVGAETGTASWGLIIDDSKGELMQGVWWGLAGVTVAMFLIVWALSVFADSLRDAFDPKLKR